VSETGRAGRAWRIHGVALVLWVALYFGLFWEVLVAEPKSGFNLDGLGAVLAGFALGIYACVTTLVVAFTWRRTAVPVVIHGLAFAACCVGVFVEQADKRERAAELERERVRQEKERQPDGCLHVGAMKVKDGKPRRAEVTLVNACDVAVVLDGETLVGFDRSGGNDILTRRETVTLARGETARTTVEGGTVQGGDPAIPVGTWAWKLSVDVRAPRSTMLCFSTPGAPDASRCADIESVKVD
jgi:hypothetical protein